MPLGTGLHLTLKPTENGQKAHEPKRSFACGMPAFVPPDSDQSPDHGRWGPSERLCLRSAFCGSAGRLPAQGHGRAAPARLLLAASPGTFRARAVVRTTCHLSAKMFWILNDESLVSPAVPSAAGANLPLGRRRGIDWQTLP